MPIANIYPAENISISGSKSVEPCGPFSTTVLLIIESVIGAPVSVCACFDTLSFVGTFTNLQQLCVKLFKKMLCLLCIYLSGAM